MVTLRTLSTFTSRQFHPSPTLNTRNAQVSVNINRQFWATCTLKGSSSDPGPRRDQAPPVPRYAYLRICTMNNSIRSCTFETVVFEPWRANVKPFILEQMYDNKTKSGRRQDFAWICFVKRVGNKKTKYFIFKLKQTYRILPRESHLTSVCVNKQLWMLSLTWLHPCRYLCNETNLIHFLRNICVRLKKHLLQLRVL
jgi:hypothetical protein